MDHKASESELGQLRKLPVRALAAFAARCARRVRPLFGSHLPGVDAVEHAIVVSERFASGVAVTDDDAQAAAKAAAWAANASVNAAAAASCPSTAFYAARFAAYSAADAAVTRSAADAASAAESAYSAAALLSFAAGPAPRTDTDRAMSGDLRRLVDLDLGDMRTLGREIDATRAGPLGALWPEGEPEWFHRACATAEAMLSNDAP